MAERVELLQITGDRPVTRETDPELWFQWQRALLLERKEDGGLSESQYRAAEARLRGGCTSGESRRPGGGRR